MRQNSIENYFTCTHTPAYTYKRMENRAEVIQTGSDQSGRFSFCRQQRHPTHTHTHTHPSSNFMHSTHSFIRHRFISLLAHIVPRLSNASHRM